MENKGKADKNPINNYPLFFIYFIFIVAALSISSQSATGSSKYIKREAERVTEYSFCFVGITGKPNYGDNW